MSAKTITIDEIALAIALFAAANYAGGMEVPWLMAAWVGLLGGLWLARKRAADRQAEWILTIADGLLLTEFVWIFAAIPLSVLPGMSLDVVWAIAATPAAYLLIRLLLATGFSWARCERVLRLVGGMVAGLTVVEFLGLGRVPYGTFHDANALSAVFYILFFPAYIQLYHAKVSGTPLRAQRGRLAFLLLMLAALAATTSLSGQLCFAGGLVLLTAILTARNRAALLLACITLASYAPLYLFANHHVAGHAAASRVASLGEQRSFTERVEMTKSTLKIYNDAPWYGTGLGTYKLLYPPVRSENEITTSGSLAHDDYVQFLAEGGPFLLLTRLGLLMLLAFRIAKLALGQLKPPQADGLPGEPLLALGYAIAALGLMLHAVMNFIFYALPLALLLGIYLARVEAHCEVGRHKLELPPIAGSRLAVLLLSAFSLFLACTLGARAAFISVVTDRCQLELCDELRGERLPLLRFANALVATQPTWFYARNFLVDNALRSTHPKHDPELALQSGRIAATELAGMIVTAPVVGYPYRQLGDLLAEFPALASELPVGVPHDPAHLYQGALARNPQDQATRLVLARELERLGQARAAYDLVSVDGMRWWDIKVITDVQRMETLQYLLPRAIGFGLCRDAREMAEGLTVFSPDSLLAKQVLAAPKADAAVKQAEKPGCGLPTPLPAA